MITDTNLKAHAAKNLIHRKLNGSASDFQLELIQSNDVDFFEIDSNQNSIIIRGNTEGNIVAGFYWYIKNYHNIHISWSSNKITIPKKLKKLDNKILRTAEVKYRYYFNICTFSYSSAFWDWKRWEEEIDLMAMYGINLPLAMVGHEYLWLLIAQNIGLSQDDLLSFLAGPAFSAWNYMGNIDGFGGPLSIKWIEEHYKLQKKIIQRMRSFGMKVILPGFYGHVPKALRNLFPEAKILQLEKWFGAEGTWFLDPSDPLFSKISKMFYEIQTTIYGNDHFYAMDLFHEGSSPNENPEYLKKTAKAVIKNLKAHDSNGVWVMQSWSMNESIVKAVPDDSVLILDLNAEESPNWQKTQAFYGKPWIWCMLHNYGGRNGMNGNLIEIYENLNLALKSHAKGKISGIGFSPEAIEENPVFYDLIAERVWGDTTQNIDYWIENYIQRRYGKSHKSTTLAWKLLLKSVYAGNNTFGATDSIICARPNLTINKVAVSGVDSYYSLKDIMQAFSHMVEAAKDFKKNNAFKYDLVDIGRESLAMLARPIYLKMMNEYSKSNAQKFYENWKLLKKIILTLNDLVGTHQDFLLGKHLERAKSWGKTSREKDLYGFNLLMQVTGWWPTVSFMDYANKHWEGLLSDYYLIRWEIFIKHLSKTINQKDKFDETAYKNEVAQFEIDFAHSKKVFRTTPAQNFPEIESEILNSLYPQIQSVLKEN